MAQDLRCNNCGKVNLSNARKCSKCESPLLLGITGTLASRQQDPTLTKAEAEDITGPRPSDEGKRRKLPLLVAGAGGALFIVLIIVAVVLLPLLRSMIYPSAISTPTLVLGVVQEPNNEYIGVNDGQYYPFDVGPQRANSGLKIKAAQALHNGDAQTATSLWEQSLSGKDTNDAEVKIYIQNQNALLAPQHVTLIVGLDFLQPSREMTAQSVLQGAYIAQKEFNDQHRNIKLRLLLANTGGELNYIPPVVQQIARIVKQDPTIVGILGWQTSSRTKNVLSALHDADITLPIVSESAGADNLTNITPYFFRMVPANMIQTRTAVFVANKVLHATHAIVFMDSKDLYSQSYGQDFEQQFPDFSEEHFAVQRTTSATFSTILKQALKNYDPRNTVIIFAATFQYDTSQFQAALGNYPGWRVITGQSGTAVQKSIYGRWYAVLPAFHDEWPTLMGNSTSTLFFNDYRSEFDPDKKYSIGYYYYEIPDANAILSYDAASVLAYGIDRTLLNDANKLTPKTLENELQQIKGSQAWQGISGLISFDSGSDPTDKALIVLKVDHTGYFQMVCVQGHFATHVSNAVASCNAI